jgi:hypothetical protein
MHAVPYMHVHFRNRRCFAELFCDVAFPLRHEGAYVFCKEKDTYEPQNK